MEAAQEVLTVNASLNPRAEIGGLTGLDTWLWCDDPGAVAVSIALRGWTAVASMRPTGFSWSIDGTDSASFQASSCGSEAHPGATWMPETKGPYSVTLSATWTGLWTLAYNGATVGTYALGPHTFSAAPLAYPVDEYRGVLVPPAGAGT